MKAITVSKFGDENVLIYGEADIPEPGEYEVRILVKAAGVNPVETYIRAGKYGALPNLPYTPGSDAAGVVDKLGPCAKGFALGDRVWIAAALARRNTGTYAEYLVCDVGAIRPLPETVSFAEGAGLGTPGLAAACALFSRAALRARETVLVHGASGGVGTLAIQLARRAGAIVLATAGDAAGEKLVRELGAHMTFDHNLDGYLDEISQASGDGPNVIVEMLADVNLAKDLSILAVRGRTVIVGSRGKMEFDPRTVMMKDGSILGMLLSNMSPEDFCRNMAILTAGLESGMKVVVTDEVPLAEASRAHALVAKGGRHGKVVLTAGS